MTDENYPCEGKSTPAAELEQQIISANVPKNEREWWAHAEILRLREAAAALAPHTTQAQSEEALREILAQEVERDCPHCQPLADKIREGDNPEIDANDALAAMRRAGGK